MKTSSPYGYETTILCFPEYSEAQQKPEILGPGLGLGKPKQDSCLRFGLSVYRIFGSETEEGGPRPQHHLGLSVFRVKFLFWEMQDTVVNGGRIEKVFNNSTTK